MRPNRHLHWVCFSCRKQFRKSMPARLQTNHAQPEQASATEDCPVCHAPMVNMGNYFRPPRHNDKRAWEQVRLLAEHDIRYYGEGSVVIWGGEGVSQRSVRATKRRLAQCSCHVSNEGQRLLQKNARKPLK